MSAEFADQFSWRHSNRVESSWCQVARCCQSRITRLVILTWASQFPVGPNKQAGHKSLPARFLRVEEGVGVAVEAPGKRGAWEAHERLGEARGGLARLGRLGRTWIAPNQQFFHLSNGKQAARVSCVCLGV